MFSFIKYLLVLLVGVAVGVFVSTLLAGSVSLVATCKVVNQSVETAYMTQDEANEVVKASVGYMAQEAGTTVESFKARIPQILDGMNRVSKGVETPCQKALKAL